MIRLGKGEIGVGDDSRVRRDRSEFDRSKINNSEVDGNEVGDNEVEKKVQKSPKFKNLSNSKKTIRSDFFTFGARLVFTKLRQAFVKALILHRFDPDHHIQIEIDVSGYAIDGVPSQLNSDDLGRWHLVASFSQKMIPAEIKYEIYDGELLAIIEAFKTWKHYLKGFQH